jgi:hypothetical protein
VSRTCCILKAEGRAIGHRKQGSTSSNYCRDLTAEVARSPLSVVLASLRCDLGQQGWDAEGKEADFGQAETVGVGATHTRPALCRCWALLHDVGLHRSALKMFASKSSRSSTTRVREFRFGMFF